MLSLSSCSTTSRFLLPISLSPATVFKLQCTAPHASAPSLLEDSRRRPSWPICKESFSCLSLSMMAASIPSCLDGFACMHGGMMAQSDPLDPAWVHACTTASTHQVLLHPLDGPAESSWCRPQATACSRLWSVQSAMSASPNGCLKTLPGPGGVRCTSACTACSCLIRPGPAVGSSPHVIWRFGAGAHSQLISSLSNMPASACVSFRTLLPGILSALKA